MCYIHMAFSTSWKIMVSPKNESQILYDRAPPNWDLRLVQTSKSSPCVCAVSFTIEPLQTEIWDWFKPPNQALVFVIHMLSMTRALEVVKWVKAKPAIKWMGLGRSWTTRPCWHPTICSKFLWDLLKEVRPIQQMAEGDYMNGVVLPFVRQS